MPAESIHLTRQELYEKAWTTSIRNLAKEFNLSDVGLAKLLKRHKIPTPGRGYWAFHEQGTTPELKPLPKMEHEWEEKITISPAGNQERKDYWALMEPRKSPDVMPITYRPANNWHPVAKNLAEFIRGTFRKASDWVYINIDDWPHISASRNQARRVPAALDVILHHLEALGAKAVSHQGPRVSDVMYMRITRAGEWCTLVFQERTINKKTPEEKPEGCLTIRVRPGGRSGDARLGWTESPTKTLEDILPDVIHRIDRSLLLDEERSRAHEEQRRREADAQKRAQELRAIERIRRAREERLFDEAIGWEGHQRTRRYLKEVEGAWVEERGAVSQAQLKWLTWAHAVNDARSPFSKSYPDVNDVPTDEKDILSTDTL